MEIDIIYPTDSRWRQYINILPHDFYHLPDYLELEAKRHNALAEAILVEDGDSIFFLPYLVRSCCEVLESIDSTVSEMYDVISPYGYPGMLVSKSGQNPSFINRSWHLIQQHWRSRKICAAFIRLHPLLNRYLDCWIDDIDPTVVCERANVVICNLNNPLEELWQQTRQNHRTKINKLRRLGFTVQMVPVEHYLDTFIDIYRETMHRVNAKSSYFFDRNYFVALMQALGEGINMCVVAIDTKVVAASIITEFSGIIQYHLGGTRTEFLPQSPNTIMFDYIRQWAKNRGNCYFNLGGGLGGDRDSLYHFKAGFSKETKIYTTIRSVVDRDNYTYLTNLRAKHLNRALSEVVNSSFFPTYRCT